MKLTPLDIHHKEFHRSMRGYSEAEVDVFLDQVADEFEKLFKENLDSKEQIEKMQDKVNQYEGQEQTLQKALFMAQQAADNVQLKAAEESEVIVKDAETKAHEVIEDAINQKQDLQKDIENLRKAEKEFRHKFRELLNSYLEVISKVEKAEDKVEVKPEPPEVKVELPVSVSESPKPDLAEKVPEANIQQPPVADVETLKVESVDNNANASVPRVTIGEPKRQDETSASDTSAEAAESEAIKEGKTDEFDFFGKANFFEQGPRDFPTSERPPRPTRPGWQPTSESVAGVEIPEVSEANEQVGEVEAPPIRDVARKVSNFFEEDLGADDDAGKGERAGQEE